MAISRDPDRRRESCQRHRRTPRSAPSGPPDAAPAGLAIDTDCHVLTEDKKAIPGLYAAGDVCGSIEEKDAKQYGMGFDAALTYGYIMGETLKKEI